MFVGFDDNRSLGSGEAGAAPAVPGLIDYMQVALRKRPARPFVRPKNAVFRTVNGIEEAFRPGTERRREEERPAPPPQPTGPQNYYDVIRREQEAAAGQTPSEAPAPPAAPPPPKKEPAEDLSGLY